MHRFICQSTRTAHLLLLAALFPLAALTLTAAPAGAQLTERISLSTAGFDADHRSEQCDVNLDGRYVVFESIGSNLATVDTNNTFDVFVRDRNTDTTILISGQLGAPDTAASGASTDPVISDDGRYITFRSTAQDLVSPPPGNTFLYRHDTQTGQSQIVSLRTDGSPALPDGVFDMDSTGRYVVFVSGHEDVVPGDTNGRRDVFRLDVNTGDVARVSLAANGVQPNQHCEWPSISRNGRFVAFESTSTNLGFPSTALQVYVKDMLTGALDLVTVDLNVLPASSGGRRAEISDLGGHVIFESVSLELYAWGIPPSGYAIYVRDLAAGTTYPASIAANGAGPNNYCYQGSLCADGRYATFQSTASNLDIGADPSTYQVFIKDFVTGTLRTLSLNTAGAPGDSSSYDAVMSGDGRLVAFRSNSTNLDGPSSNTFDQTYLRDRSYGTVHSYGVSQPNSLGCVAHVTTTGAPSASAGSGFVIDCGPVRNNQPGILFYGTNGARAVPLLGGTLYVAPPSIRTAPQSSGGSPSGSDCSGRFIYDFNVRIASGADPGLVPGARVNVQFWSRDPGGVSHTNLSNAVSFEIAP